MRMKVILLTLLIFIILPLLVFAILPVLAFDVIRPYSYRNVECQPSALISEVKENFDINLPQGIKNIKSAKSIVEYEGYLTTFIMKFEIDPNTWDNLFKMIKEKYKETIDYEEYQSDSRPHGLWIPKWFKKPIKSGQIVSIESKYGRLFGNVDTSNKRLFIVYLNGWYRTDKKINKAKV